MGVRSPTRRRKESVSIFGSFYSKGEDADILDLGAWDLEP